MSKSSQECLNEAMVEMIKLVLASNDRATCSRLQAAFTRYNDALVDEQTERIRNEQVAMPIRQYTRHWREVN